MKLPIYSLFICLFSLLMPSVLQAQSTTPVKLRLQLGAYRNTAMGKFDRIKLNELKGAIYTEDIGNGIKRVFIGDYSTADDAEKALEKLKTMGFETAYIVSVDAVNDNAVKQKPSPSKQAETDTPIDPLKKRGGKATNTPSPTNTDNNSQAATTTNEKQANPATTTTTTNTAPKPAPTPEKLSYIIQLGSFSQVNFKSFGNVADLGDISAERIDNVFKIYLGTYTSRNDADRILEIVKQRAYDKAFIKAIPVAEK